MELVLFCVLTWFASAAKQTVENKATVRVELDAGDEIIATRRCLVSCESEDELRDVHDPTFDRGGLFLWIRSRFRRREPSAISRLSAPTAATVELSAARPGWSLKEVTLDENEVIAARSNCVVSALGSSLQLDGNLIKFQGGILTLAGPGNIVKRRGPALIDDRRLIAYSSSTGSSSSVHSSANGVRWRRFPASTDHIFTSTAISEPSVVVIQNQQSSAPTLIPGRRSSLIAKLTRFFTKYIMTIFALLLTAALTRCRFQVAKLPRSFLITVRDFRQTVITLSRLASLISNDLHTVLSERKQNPGNMAAQDHNAS